MRREERGWVEAKGVGLARNNVIITDRKRPGQPCCGRSRDMRVAIVSDIHGNLTAFDAVLEDIRQASPDLVLHGGDLADGGSSPKEIVDCIRDLGWRGVMGNTDEMLVQPDALEDFASQSSAPPARFAR
jgi:Calcineurin-like phosphoesterase superfamily domain